MEQPCFSGRRWIPQKVIPQRHGKPVSPTLFRQVVHRTACGCAGGASSVGADDVSMVEAEGLGRNGLGGGEEE
ncbi:hypothetical protein IEQ34_005175 [Dendrobium chrysotoxum]|uniref:Uncharacterized protein n=1 Tax=Dendrobium chrysotoxum TaxID=161865 RepID=A0AAV7H7U5_DENCH|nr:hypothetical protein IEQ34_005175 [Dendrobium chrysotoxum]